MIDAMLSVAEFHHKHGSPVHDTYPGEKAIGARLKLRLGLVREELTELEEAAGFNWSMGDYVGTPQGGPDIIAMADALADITYVVIGAALEWGIPLDLVFDEVHRSNMTKTPGHFRDDGKIIKGPDYSPPNIAGALAIDTEGRLHDLEAFGCTQCGWYGTGHHACPGVPE